METTVDAATMYPNVRKTETAIPTEGPNALPVNVTNDPVDGVRLENSAIVFVRKRITIIAVRMVKGAASPAPCTMTAKPKKKLIAGAMLARVDETMWLAVSASRRRRLSPTIFAAGSVLFANMTPFSRLMTVHAAPGSRRKHPLFVFDLVAQYTDAFDLNFAHIPMLHEQRRIPRHSNPGRSAGHDDVAG